MKWLFNIMFIALPVLTVAQSDAPSKNGIGVHLTYDKEGGIGTSLRYKRQLANRGIMKFEFQTNSNGKYIGRVGYEFIQIRNGKFELGMGLDLRYKFENLKKYGQPNYKEYALEFPIELRYHISPKFTIQAGVSYSKRLGSNNDVYNQSRSGTEFRLGTIYNF